jgi:hypothetical protein
MLSAVWGSLDRESAQKVFVSTQQEVTMPQTGLETEIPVQYTHL